MAAPEGGELVARDEVCAEAGSWLSSGDTGDSVSEESYGHKGRRGRGGDASRRSGGSSCGYGGGVMLALV